MGRLEGIARRDRKRAPMLALEHAEISRDTGVARDFRGKPGDRQVTVISLAAWRAVCADIGREIPWTTRRANLLVDGVELARTTGSVICVGPVRLRVTGELDPCSRMDEQFAGLTDALRPDWRGGVTCAVLEGGSVALGDAVSLQPAGA